MAQPGRSLTLPSQQDSAELARQWRVLTRAATFVAVLTSPAAYVYLHKQLGWSVGWSIAGAFGIVAAFRGFIDLVLRRFIPWPTLFGVEDPKLQDDDVVNRRRAWFWRFWYRIVAFVLILITIVWIKRLLFGPGGTWVDAAQGTWNWIDNTIHNPQLTGYVIILPFLFLINFLILFGPLVFMGISQIRGFEPGDADWGVRLNDVRGQKEAKEEVRRIVSLWQSGELFEEAGGKRERGLLFLGAPGTGKTMLAKAIATGFNSPFVSIPGSGFAQTFIGMDVVIVRWLARKAKKLASKWGGQCIVFIDEIDAVGMRRSSLGGASGGSFAPTNLEDFLFFGRNGALNPSGDMILETRAWRERLFNERAPERRSPYPPFVQKLAAIVNQGVMPGMMGGTGQLGLNQLLIVMDGVDNPPFMRRVLTNKINGLLDASYVIPPRVGKVRLRLPTPKPRKEQIYFIGATNVPIENLDPALTRPGRMGRHVWFRTPTKQDRLDIFDLYITKVAHDPELDRPERRDEMARITMGYSPAMIEQVCSLALTYAHHQGRPQFVWDDLVEAMTTLESGTAIGIDYIPEETRAVAIHEAGHAVAGHVYMKGRESTRLSIRMRGGSLGHHQAMEREERFSRFRSEEMGLLVWGLGAMAAERVFYGENSNGVGGDLMSTTAAAAWMVGASGMGPEPLELNGSIGYRQNGSLRRLTAQEQREAIMKRFEEIGLQLMNRTGSGPMDHNPIGAVLSDPYKRRTVAQILGQAYMKAHHLIEHNKMQVERIAEAVIEKKELYGDELVRLLDGAKLEVPQVDLTKESAWPVV
jgi:cell division protease FtsH